MIHRLAFHNGRVYPSGDAVFSAGQLGLLAGWGVFTTIRVTEGVLFAWERHWARMSRDALLMHVPMPADAGGLQADLERLVDANGQTDCTLRLVIVRNSGGIWEGAPTGVDCDVVAMTAATKKWGESVQLGVQEQGRHAASKFAGTKINSWAMNLTYLENAQRRGFDEVILLNERGEVAELTSANIFVANGGVVLTPPLSSGCLPGITREVLLNEVRVAEYQVRERALSLDDLYAADEVFITSSTRDLLAVAAIEGRVLNRKGGAMAALKLEFQKYLTSYIRSHMRSGVR